MALRNRNDKEIYRMAETGAETMANESGTVRLEFMGEEDASAKGRPRLSSHSFITGWAESTSWRYTPMGYNTSAKSGNAAVISSILLARPPVPCVQKGMIVFPEKSYSSMNENIAMGAVYHQFGKPRKTTS